MIRSALVAGLLAAAALPALPARADDRPGASGPYAELGVGATSALGDHARYAAPGPVFALRAGTDLFPWLSLGGRISASTHEATVPAPPEGEYVQLYAGAAELRLSTRVGRLALYADGALGAARMSTDVLAKVAILDPGERSSLLLAAGGGLEYQLQNRHFALGLGGDWSLLPAFDALQAVSGRGYLRYTY